MRKSVQILADSAPSTQFADSTTLVKLELHGENWRIATTCTEVWNWINANNLLPPSVHLSHFLQCQLWPVFFSSSSSLAYRISFSSTSDSSRLSAQLQTVALYLHLTCTVRTAAAAEAGGEKQAAHPYLHLESRRHDSISRIRAVSV